MKREEYINGLLEIYDVVSVLSAKNGGKVLRLRNKKIGTDIVLRSYQGKTEAYEKLCTIECVNLPIIYDTVNLDDGQIVLEEYIEGITVAEVMETGKYRYLGAKKVVKGICNALTVLESLKVVHRDIKPENIIIGGNGRVVLIDFNASRIVSGVNSDTVIMGTVGYASPEQLGITESDSRTDIYSVGILLNVMMTGKHPSEKIAGGKSGRIIRKCTNINPSERFQTAEKLSMAL